MSVSRDTFDFVAALVRREAAIVLEAGKEYLVDARLQPLARAAGLDSVDDYVLGVKRHPAPLAVQQVVDALTTNETSWMRDNAPFEALVSEVAPAVMATKRGSQTLTFWSAACSSGQEPYGIAMVLDDLLRTSGWKLNIVASDISSDMLQKATKGVYSQLEVNRGLPASMLVKHFSRHGAGWKISDHLRSSITFQKINIAQPLPVLPKFDVIFLRNVLIYFDTPTKQAVLRRVRQVLADDGFLFLGGAETTLGVDASWQRMRVGRAFAYCPALSSGSEPSAVPVAGGAHPSTHSFHPSNRQAVGKPTDMFFGGQ